MPHVARMSSDGECAMSKVARRSPRAEIDLPRASWPAKIWAKWRSRAKSPRGRARARAARPTPRPPNSHPLQLLCLLLPFLIPLIL
eukprot:1309229-Pyramimonas_sp.AAC.1